MNVRQLGKMKSRPDLLCEVRIKARERGIENVEEYLRGGGGANSNLRPSADDQDNFASILEQPSSILSLSNHMMHLPPHREDSSLCLVDDLFGSDNNPYVGEESEVM